MFNPTSEEIRYMLSHIDDDRGPMLVGVTSMSLVLCFTATSARFLARRITQATLAVDDFLALVALVLFIGLVTVCFLFVRYGTGKHLLALTPAAAKPSGKLTLALELIYTATITTAKASLLMLYRRIFTIQTKWFRVGWWLNFTFIAMYYVGVTIQLCFQCLPKSVDHLWKYQDFCQPNFTVAKIIGSLNACMDVTLLLLPIPMVWGLQMPRKRKIAVSGIFGVGLLGCIISIFRVPALGTGWNDYTYNIVPNLIWTITEPAAAIVCACLPLLRPLFRRPTTKPHHEEQSPRPSQAKTPPMHLLGSRSSPIKSGLSPLMSGLSHFKTSLTSTTKSSADSEGDAERNYSRDGDSFRR